MTFLGVSPPQRSGYVGGAANPVLRDLDRSCGVSFLRRNTTGDSTLLLGSPDFTPLSEDTEHSFGSSTRHSHMRPFPHTAPPPPKLDSATGMQLDATAASGQLKQPGDGSSTTQSASGLDRGNGQNPYNAAIVSCAASGGIPMYARHGFGPIGGAGVGMMGGASLQPSMPGFAPSSITSQVSAGDQSAPFFCKAQYFLV
ncbi:MAG: hypothetical protein WDW38_008151 [Sanguina aurantia]